MPVRGQALYCPLFTRYSRLPAPTARFARAPIGGSYVWLRLHRAVVVLHQSEKKGTPLKTTTCLLCNAILLSVLVSIAGAPQTRSEESRTTKPVYD